MGRWWFFIGTGAVWILASFAVLQLGLRSTTEVATVFGAGALSAGVNEFVIAAARRRWRWGHATLGVLFVGAAVLAWLWPSPGYQTLAALVGWCLLAKGTVDIVLALAERRSFELWWLRLISGVVELLLAFWVVDYPARSVSLLVLWLGLSALLRGITEIVLGFGGRHMSAPIARTTLSFTDPGLSGVGLAGTVDGGRPTGGLSDGGFGSVGLTGTGYSPTGLADRDPFTEWPDNPAPVRPLTGHSAQDSPYPLPMPNGSGAHRAPGNGTAGQPGTDPTGLDG
ncbi:MAG: DUF308 domain-containing protein [Actinocatenispora sp.]